MRKWPPVRLLRGWGRVLGYDLVDLGWVLAHAKLGQLELSSLWIRGCFVFCCKLGGLTFPTSLYKTTISTEKHRKPWSYFLNQLKEMSCQLSLKTRKVYLKGLKVKWVSGQRSYFKSSFLFLSFSLPLSYSASFSYLVSSFFLVVSYCFFSVSSCSFLYHFASACFVGSPLVSCCFILKASPCDKVCQGGNCLTLLI